jgi:fatty-acyl-CoA synthase
VSDLLVGDVFRNAAVAVADRLAVAVGDDHLTFGEVDRQANAVANHLRGLGVEHRDRVVVWADTEIDVVPSFAALAKLGAVFTPISPLLAEGEALALLKVARARLLVVDEPRADLAATLSAKVGLPVVALRDLGTGQPDSDIEAPTLDEADPHVVFFTSGSTGRPKGVVLSHRTNMLRTHPGATLEPRGVLVCPYPLFHMGAWTLALQQWQARDAAVFVKPVASEICDAVDRHRAARLNCIPGVWQRILDHLASHDEEPNERRYVRFADTGTSATPREFLETIAARFPAAHVRVFYGSTEAGGVAMLEHADIPRKPGSCGTPAVFSEVRLDADGQLLVRNPFLFDGYLNDPGATAEVLVDGWYATGDVASIDGDGYLSIIGRVRDVIRSGGESVAPTEVEIALGTHPAIADVAVVGLPDVQWGEVVCAAVVPVDRQSPPSLEDLRAHCEHTLTPFKRPRRLVVVESIPRTASTNQIQRPLLIERILLTEV